MDFRDTPEEAAFRAEVRAWLQANGTARSRPDEMFGEGLDDAAKLAAAKAWQAKKAAAGYAAIAWPTAVMSAVGSWPNRVQLTTRSVNAIIAAPRSRR